MNNYDFNNDSYGASAKKAPIKKTPIKKKNSSGLSNTIGTSLRFIIIILLCALSFIGLRNAVPGGLCAREYFLGYIIALPVVCTLLYLLFLIIVYGCIAPLFLKAINAKDIR